jgi:uncharacterized surface protein with fasciclin (FAS1) repeats
MLNMKSTRLMMIALAAVVALASCAKDDAEATAKTSNLTSEAATTVITHTGGTGCGDKGGNLEGTGADDRSAPTQTIVQIAVGAKPEFTALVAAVVKTGLTDALNQTLASYTVFAPTDAAFAKLPAPLNNAANISAITETATINTLRNVLLYHVQRGRMGAASLNTGMKLSTLLVSTNGVNQELGLTVEREGLATIKSVVVNGRGSKANVVAANIQAVNGIIHVIDNVLIP